MNIENIHGKGVNIKMPSGKDVLNSIFLLSSAATLLIAMVLLILIAKTTNPNIGNIVLVAIIFISGFVSAIIPYNNIPKLIKSKKVIDGVLMAFWFIGIGIGLIILGAIVVSLLSKVWF